MSIAAYVAKRVLVSIVLLVALTFLTFWLYQLTPIDPARVVIGAGPAVIPQQMRDQIDHALGTDRPLVTQYVDWVDGVVHGDLGIAWQGATVDPDGGAFGTSVVSEIVPATWRSLSVVAGGLALLLLFVVPIAALSAARPGSWFDRTTAALLLIGISTHPLVVGLILQSFQRRWGWLPQNGYCPMRGSGGGATLPDGSTCHGLASWASHLVMPWFTFAVFFAALYVRVLRATLLEVLDEPFVSTARAKGASEPRVLLRHALRNAFRPILTMTGMEAGMAVTVLLYIEVVFGIGGLGRLSLDAFSGDLGYDRPVILALVLFLGIGIIGLNLLVDLLYPVIDPRVTAGAERRRLLVGPAA
jgi:peptide/nickel transport system permease protein